MGTAAEDICMRHGYGADWVEIITDGDYGAEVSMRCSD